MLVENKKLSSVGGSDPTQDIYLPYVVNDIASFFTLLVGIYFPSVTGESATNQTPTEYNNFFFFFLRLRVRVVQQWV